MQHELITTHEELTQFCERLSACETIAFDTEFVSEDCYLPDLCLIQVAAGGRLAVIDPRTIDDLTPFWNVLATGGHETIVHAGREEYQFCRRAIGRRPAKLVDVQIAAGLIGLEYPAAYNTLVSKVLGKPLGKGETRTNWRRRPLSERQLEYALQDVLYLEPLRGALYEQLQRRGRLAWLDAEVQAWQDRLDAAESEERWQRTPGTNGLSRRSLAIVRELWRWREGQARQRNRHPRRVLRDDLMVELARRQTADVKRIRAVRGLERRDLRSSISEIADTIQRALGLPDDECPRHRRRTASGPPLTLLGQFLTTALAAICRQAKVAPSIVGTTQDVREFVAHRLGIGEQATDTTPSLSQGWRAEIVGQMIDDLLAGRTAVRVDDPLAEQPLEFVHGTQSERETVKPH